MKSEFLFALKSVQIDRPHYSLKKVQEDLTRPHSGFREEVFATYSEGTPHIQRHQKTPDAKDSAFSKISRSAFSSTHFMALSKDLAGPPGALTTHAHQMGPWTYMSASDFSWTQPLTKDISSRVSRRDLHSFFEPDSQVLLFLFIMGEMLETESLWSPVGARTSLDRLNGALKKLDSLRGKHGETESFTPTFTLSNGEILWVHAGLDLPMLLSHSKTVCPERTRCESLKPACESSVANQNPSYVMVSNEAFGVENQWLPLSPGETLAVDVDLNLYRS